MGRSSKDNTHLPLALHDRRFKCSYDGLGGEGEERKKREDFNITNSSGITTVKEKLTSSNTFFNPFWVRAEHSTYLTAPSSLASLSPCSIATGLCFCLANLSITCESSLRSTCVPTIRHGTPGQ